MEYTYTGIDVAKDSFVVAVKLEGKVTTTLHNNDKKGINSFLKSLSSQSWCIMEAEPQMHGLRSAGSGFTACSWPSPCMRRESRCRW
jgi:hypothetical protein